MIIISGVDGSGKTTLANHLAMHYHSPGSLKSKLSNQSMFGLKEDQLALRYALDFLRERMNLLEDRLDHPSAIFDASVYEDLIRLKLMADLGLIAPKEVNQYAQNIHYRIKQLPFQRAQNTQHLFVYLNLSFKEMLSRKLAEKTNYHHFLHTPILYEYYKELHRRYQLWFERYSCLPKFSVEMNQYDLHDLKDIQKLAQKIQQILTTTAPVHLTAEKLIANVEQSILQME